MTEPTSGWTLNRLLQRLDELRVHYRIDKTSEEAIIVEAFLPGEHWEIEFFDDGHVEVERFRSAGEILDESGLEALWTTASDNRNALTVLTASPDHGGKKGA